MTGRSVLHYSVDQAFHIERQARFYDKVNTMKPALCLAALDLTQEALK